MTRMQTMRWSALAVALAALLMVGPCVAGEKVTVGQRWSADRQVTLDQIDHSDWDRLLQRYVDDRGMVDYTAWKSTPSDVRVLDDYLAALSAASLRQPTSRQGQLAYWINAYNAVTIKGILREYPTSSIRNHTARVFGYNIWDDLLLVVGDRTFSLSQIEHDVLRKMGEPRIHFSIVCASIGCPKLSNRAYTADELEQQLARSTRDFFADPSKFRSDPRSGRIQISPIFKWFAEDFGGSMLQRLAMIAPYLPDDASRRLATSGQAQVSYLGYDWDLNDQATAGARPPRTVRARR